MSITPIGILLILVGIYFFIRDQRSLYNLTIFFLPFSATAVINLGQAGEGTAIQPYMFLGGLLIVSHLFPKGGAVIKFHKSEVISLFLLFLFAACAAVSLFMPYYINGSEQGNVDGRLGESQPIILSFRNVTQLVYLIFGIFFSVVIYLHNRTANNYRNTIRVYAYSVLFVMAWGILELITWYLKLPYPAIIFNNSYSASAGGFNAVMDGEEGMKRISSVAVEPSILVQTIILFLPYLLIPQLNKTYIFGKRRDQLFILAIILFIFRSTSTTGIVCLFLLLLMFFILYFKSASVFRKIIIAGGGLLFSLLFAVVFYQFLNEFLQKTLFEKGETYSALERTSVVADAWQNFLHYPLLGTGWGSVGSYDLFVRILSNTGILGCLLFVSFIMSVLINQMKATNQLNPYKYAAFISFSITIFGNIISGFTFTFGFFWMIVGLALITRLNNASSDNLSAIP